MPRTRNPKSPDLLNHVDHFYFDRVGPLVPAHIFQLPEKLLYEIEQDLGIKFEEVDKRVLQDSCETFVNAVSFDQLRVHRSHLASYAKMLSKRAGDLVALLREPGRVSPEFSRVQPIL